LVPVKRKCGASRTIRLLDETAEVAGSFVVDASDRVEYNETPKVNIEFSFGNTTATKSQHM
jgi:hypothetical protein